MKTKIKTIALAGLSLAASLHALAIGNDQELKDYYEAQPSTHTERRGYYTSPEATQAKDYALAHLDAPMASRVAYYWGVYNRDSHPTQAEAALESLVQRIENGQPTDWARIIVPVYVQRYGSEQDAHRLVDAGHIPPGYFFRLSAWPELAEQVALSGLGQGIRGNAWNKWFTQHVASLDSAAALPVLEAEIRGLLTKPASDARDAWIKELRAQYVVTKSFVE